jgi:EmrB/QacA subfamily drug resistance transporter
MTEKRFVLVSAILGSGIVFLDGTVVNVALPAIRDSLHAGLADQQWVVEAYLLTLSSLLLIGGSLGDRLGRRRIFSAGLVGFGVCSAACAVAPSSAVLIFARALQGVFGAMLVPSTLAMIMDTFGEDEQAGAIGTWTAWTGIATVIGPLGGGFLIQAASWRWIFAINIPAVVATLWMLSHVDPDRPEGGGVDYPGALLAAFGLGGPVFALIEQPRYGWGDARVVVPLFVGVALFVAFLVRESRASEPMMRLDLFRSRNFAIGNLTTFSLYGGLAVALFFLTLFLQQVGGYTPLAAGVATLPITLLLFSLSRRTGMLAAKVGSRLFMGIGPIVAGAGLLVISFADASATYPSQILPGLILFGLGMSATVAPLTATVLGAVHSGHSGVASGINNAVSRVAGLIAIAALGAVVSAGFANRLDSDLSRRTLAPSTRAAVARARSRPLVVDTSGAAPADRRELRAALVDASVHAFRLGMLIGALLAIVGGVLSLLGIQNRVVTGPAPAPG